ncbi:CDP-diacylglycerol--glycerol-3-phosphate 3-phosphatidyltransferase 2 isoform X1 [Cornus florida]|uniref:CDP-diacylglycerol--glycerol-3-phosphate 3-phosphatidyltransferase 2 isoform X1 n=1 Tax=Cornus florida TaxID=4283 RepID=UPI0028976AC8|nr:CDP-diacylglycerol--glycerol-3-phosphate 3-phosphatidyltransferase 2 isoform X1 [Cornus florida]
MSGLKLTIVASIYSKPYNLDKWVRTLATTTNITPRPKPSTSFYTHTDRTPVSCTPVLRITPYAPLAPYSKLGFRGQKIFYSSEDNKGVVEGGSSGLATDMGTESKDDYCYDSDRSPPSHNHHHPPPPPQQQHKKEQHQQSTKLLTLPTILTIGRVATVPLLVGTFYVDSWWGTTATTSIFIAAAFTDWLDGYIARKMRLGSAFGAFLDPVADKLMVAATLVLLCTRPMEVPMLGQVPWLLAVPSIAIIGREITMSAVREWAASQNTQLLEAVAVNNLGKWKTASQMAALTILLATRDNSLTGAGVVVASGVSLLYVSAGLAVWSLVVYMRKIWKVLLK